jgi:hypothetical protein
MRIKRAMPLAGALLSSRKSMGSMLFSMRREARPNTLFEE